MPLSDASIRNAKAQTKHLKLFDGGGLFLLVTRAGGKRSGKNWSKRCLPCQVS